MDVTQHDSRYSWIRLGLSLGLAIVGNIGMWAVIVVLPDMQAEFGIDRANASLPYVATMLGFALGNLTLGPAVDRWGISPVLALAAGALSVGFGLAAISGSVLVVSLVHVILGLGASASFAPLIADVSQWFMRRRGIAVAIAASGNYLSGTLWPPVIVLIASDYGWRGAYMALAVMVLAVLLPGTLLLRRQLDVGSTEHATRHAAARAQTTGLSPGTLQILLAIAGVGCCVAMSMPQVHIVALCIDRGFGSTAGAEMLSLMLAGGVVSRVAFGVLADRIGGLLTLLLGAVLQCVALCLFLIEGGIASLYLVSLIFGLSQGGIVPSYAIIVREYMPPREAGRRVGLVMASTIIGMALGGWMSGWLYDQSGSYALAIWNGIGWNLITIVITLLILVRIGTPRAAVA
ncbi:MAG: MFS transporter [Roseovarius sp.]|uniref:MFS transporter n=1 Tax=Roseovarius sp. TaxID=1486281 RepID=UPI0032ECDF50